MNNFKKIGLSALAGSLVAMSAQAADVSLSGGASVAFTSAFDSDKTGYYMNDSITATVSGETDGGLTITTSLEMDGGANASSSFDSRSLKIAHDDFGTVTFAGHGGDSVMGGWDDMMPTAYEEVFALTKNQGDAVVGAGNLTIAGASGDNLWRFDSNSYSGVSFHAAYQSANATTGRVSSYNDMGIQIAPEMVDGLTIGIASGEYDESATVTGIDVSTMWAKYAIGSFTVGVQQSENDGPTAATTDESDSWAVSYAVSDDLSISYGQHDYEGGTDTDIQESSGFSASYTMGGTSIKAAFNETDNIRNVATDDEDSFEIALSFAF
jgi:outer membrane protein OmpU